MLKNSSRDGSIQFKLIKNNLILLMVMELTASIRNGFP